MYAIAETTKRRREEEEEEKKRKIEKKEKLGEKGTRRNQFCSLALVEHSTTRTIGVRERVSQRVGTCGLKVAVLGETTSML